jgi:hypothetical protein
VQRSPAVLWAVGDGDAGATSDALVRRIERGRIDRLLYLGDVYESGTAAEFRSNYHPTWGRLARVTAPTPGNHDWPNHADGYDPYWQRIRGTQTPGYYSFRVAGWELLSLNSQARRDPGSPQVRWLRARLRKGTGTCRIAFWHRPRFNAGMHGDQPDITPFWDAVRGKARIVVNGHDHNMQRLVAISGTTTFISGAAGHSQYPVNEDDSRLAFGNDTDYGALRLRLRPGSASYAFVAADGRRLDSGRVRCRRR